MTDESTKHFIHLDILKALQFCEGFECILISISSQGRIGLLQSFPVVSLHVSKVKSGHKIPKHEICQKLAGNGPKLLATDAIAENAMKVSLARCCQPSAVYYTHAEDCLLHSAPQDFVNIQKNFLKSLKIAKDNHLLFLLIPFTSFCLCVCETSVTLMVR